MSIPESADGRARREAEEALEMFRSIVETISEWIWAVDANFVLTYSNPAVKRILGYEATQMIGRDRHAFIDAADREAVEVESEQRALQRPAGYVGAIALPMDGSSQLGRLTSRARRCRCWTKTAS